MSEIHKILRERHSPIKFLPDRISEADISLLFEAATLAPSSYNSQPWRFIISTADSDTFRDFLKCLPTVNREWAQQAPLVGFACGSSDFSITGKRSSYTAYNVALAMANLSFQATSMGLCVHQMARFNRISFLKRFNPPKGVSPIVAFAVGKEDLNAFRSQEDIERLAKSRTRLGLDKILFVDKFS
jgi:nitroreductase